jgi:hypothetical protein
VIKTLLGYLRRGLPFLESRESITEIVPGTGLYDVLTLGGNSQPYTGRTVNPQTAMTFSGFWALRETPI